MSTYGRNLHVLLGLKVVGRQTNSQTLYDMKWLPLNTNNPSHINRMTESMQYNDNYFSCSKGFHTMSNDDNSVTSLLNSS